MGYIILTNIDGSHAPGHLHRLPVKDNAAYYGGSVGIRYEINRRQRTGHIEVGTLPHGYRPEAAALPHGARGIDGRGIDGLGGQQTHLYASQRHGKFHVARRR